jgi:hypothetical protein
MPSTKAKPETTVNQNIKVKTFVKEIKTSNNIGLPQGGRKPMFGCFGINEQSKVQLPHKYGH